jgi:hypothetical protein
MIFHLDERRMKILGMYSVIFVAIIGFVADLIHGRENVLIGFGLKIAACSVLVAGVLVGLAVIFILKSERDANIRYRNKMNLIRGLFLDPDRAASGDQRILLQKYLTIGEQWGVKTHNSKSPPHGWGSTLGKVLLVVGLEMFVLVLGVGYIVWLDSTA